MSRMKLKKEVGCNGIPMKAWIYGGETVQRGLIEVKIKV